MEDLEALRAKRAAIIYNPVARGLSRRQHLIQRTIPILGRHGVEARLVATTGPGSATGQARHEIEAGADLIIAAGGDGTINEVANGMLNSGVPLGILPGGTANVLAREMRVPIKLEKAISGVLHYTPVRVAVGGIQIAGEPPRSFLCMAGAGLDADIVSRLNLDLKAAAGKLAFYVCGFAQIFRSLPEFEVSIDGKTYVASFALISRVRNYGGDLEIARRASLLREDFEVVLFRGTHAFQYLPYFVGVALGRINQMKGVTVLHGQSVLCHGKKDENIFVQVDGELAGRLPVQTKIIPDALTLLAPPEYLVRERAFAAVPVCA